MSDQISRVEQEIEALRRSLSVTGLPAAAVDAIRAQLAAREAQLAALRRAPSGRRPGSIIDFSGAQTGDITIGDVAGRDIYKGNVFGPTVTGPISSGRDTNIATEQTITNTGETRDAQRPPPQHPTTPAPTLRLALSNDAGEPVRTLTIGQEVRLRLDVVGAPEQLPALELTLEADGEGVSWPEGTRRRLVLRPGATVRPIRWSLIAEREGAVAISVLALSDGALVQQLTLMAQASPDEQGTLSGTSSTAPAPLQLPTVGLALGSAGALPSRGDALTLVLSFDGRRYRLLLADTGESVELAVSDQQLAELNAFARAELLAIVRSTERGVAAYTRSVAIPEPLAMQTLSRLAQLGAALWAGLFSGPGAGHDSAALGERLRARSQERALRITIAGDVGGFPWQLLYDRELAQAVTPEGFWGLRHVVALLPTRGRVGQAIGDLTINAQAGLRSLSAFNLGIERGATGQQVLAPQRAAITALGFTGPEVNDEHALRSALGAGTDASLVYLFCHMSNALPGQQPRGATGGRPVGVGDTRIMLTDDARAITLRDLQLAAPLDGRPRLSAGPLVLVNACGSAALSPLSYDGLAPYLLDLGARTLIGTECDTPVVFGASFGPAVLRAFVGAGRPIGEALREARRLLAGPPTFNALGLLYTLYGSADLVVTRSEPAPHERGA